VASSTANTSLWRGFDQILFLQNRLAEITEDLSSLRALSKITQSQGHLAAIKHAETRRDSFLQAIEVWKGVLIGFPNIEYRKR
jgi:hypothetical protein